MRKSTSISRAKARPSSRAGNGPDSVAAAQVRRLAHPARARRKLGTLCLSIRMRGECRKGGRQVRLAATRTSDCVSVFADQFLELGPAIVTDIFVNRHISEAPGNSFSSILAQKLHETATPGFPEHAVRYGSAALLVAQGDHRVHAHGSERRNERGEERHGAEQDCHA